MRVERDAVAADSRAGAEPHEAVRLGGRRIDHFPSDAQVLGRCQPIYTIIPGWKEDISKAKKLSDLPAAARRYVDAISGAVGLPVSLVSVGPDRDQTIIT